MQASAIKATPDTVYNDLAVTLCLYRHGGRLYFVVNKIET